MTPCSCQLLAVGLPESESEFLMGLKNAGIQIVLTNTGKEALQQIGKQKIDLIIVDGALPNSQQICQTLSEATDAPISLLLGPNEVEQLDTFVSAPIDHFFLKSTAMPEVLAHLRSMRRRQTWQKSGSQFPRSGSLQPPKESVCCFHTV